MPTLTRLTDPDDAPLYDLYHDGAHIGVIRQRYGVWILTEPSVEIIAAHTDLSRLIDSAPRIMERRCQTTAT